MIGILQFISFMTAPPSGGGATIGVFCSTSTSFVATTEVYNYANNTMVAGGNLTASRKYVVGTSNSHGGI